MYKKKIPEANHFQIILKNSKLYGFKNNLLWKYLAEM
jgi:hypothetical protein